MAKSAKKQGKATAKKGKKKAVKKATKKAAGGAAPTHAAHNAVFKSLAVRSNQHNAAPVCYQQLAGGGWLICFLQGDGSYGQCQPYSGPIHQPPCG
jgi:hypothetical protein